MEITVSIWKEEDMYVAKGIELGVASQGKTKDEALANLKEAVELYFEDEDTKTIPKREIVKLKIAV
jgi:predicted RNase H-like HicB family nuclease